MFGMDMDTSDDDAGGNGSDGNTEDDNDGSKGPKIYC